MVSRPPITLDYEVGTVFYPRLRGAPRWLLILIALLPVPIGVGCWMVISGGTPAIWRIGALYLGVSALTLIGLTLLYIPAATWLCVRRTGITLSVAFWRRSVAWSRVRKVRLVLMEGAVQSDPVVEVDLNEPWPAWRPWRGRPPSEYWLIHLSSFGWSPEAVLGAMERWRCDDKA